eukprot:564312-Rhodomonas_salina.1
MCIRDSLYPLRPPSLLLLRLLLPAHAPLPASVPIRAQIGTESAQIGTECAQIGTEKGPIGTVCVTAHAQDRSCFANA